MRIQKHSRAFLSSTAMVAALLVSTALVPQAFAQKNAFLSPVSPWALTKVGEQSAGGEDAYCALARRFKKDTVLTIARNKSSESSLAIDFHIPKFNESEPLNVVLDPGAGEQREYEVYPVSSRALVVRFGQDEKFFAALERTGYLRAEVGGQAYSFNLADIDAGAQKLSGCLASMVLPAAGDVGTGDEGALAAANDHSYRQEINALRADVRALEDENKDLLVRVGEGVVTETVTVTETLEVSKPEDLEAIAQGLKTIAEGALTAQKLADRISVLEEEKKALGLKLVHLRTSNKVTTIRADSGDAVLAGMKKEAQRLRKALQGQEVVSQEIPSLKAEITALESANENLRKLAREGNLSSEVAQSMDREALGNLTAENKALKKTLSEKIGFEAEVARLGARLHSLDSENEKLRADLALSEVAQQEVQDAALGQVRDLARAQGTLRKDLEQAQVLEISKLSAAAEKSAAKIKAQDKKLVALSGVSLELATLKAEKEALEIKLSALSGDASALKVLTEKASGLEAENTILKTKLSTALAARDASDIQTLSNSEAFTALGVENEKLSAALLAQAGLASDLAAVKDTLKEKMAENQALEARLTAQTYENQRLAEASETPDNSGYEQALQEALSENASLKEDLAAQVTLFSRLTSLQAEFDVLTTENKTLRNQFQAYKDDAQWVQAEGLAQREGHEILRHEFLSLQKENAELREQVSFLMTRSVSETPRDSVALSSDILPEITSEIAPDMRTASASAPAPIPAPEKEPALAAIPSAPVVEVSEVAALEVREVPEFISDDAFAAVRFEAEERMALQKGAPVSFAPPVSAALPDEPLVPSLSREISRPSQQENANYAPSFSLFDMLQKAEISADSGFGLMRVPLASGMDKIAYEWRSSNIFASAEQTPIKNSAQFEVFVQNYLEKTQQRCPGEFAILPDDSVDNGSTRVDSYEIACVGKDVNSSAALIFFNKEGTFTAMAHEAETAELDAAMGLRDRLFRVISGT